MDEARRKQHERRIRARAYRPWSVEPESTEHWSELHAAIERLPAKYRDPIVLCYLEGLTHEQAARQLSWPVGTVKTRLARGRERLRRRLRGFDRTFPAAPSQTLLHTTSEAALRFASRPGTASSAVTTITEGILKMMWIDRLRSIGITALALIAAAGFGASIVAQQVAGTGGARVESGIPVQILDKPGSQSILVASATTDFDPATVTIVRSQFDCRVDKVLVDLGSAVKKADPLCELFSADLAAAKNDFETARMQHDRDLKILGFKKPLVNNGNLSAKELIEGENDEAKSRLAMQVAKDKLMIFGLSDEEIGRIANEDGVHKAKMILRSRSDGIVINRTVVRGNYYDGKDKLMRIAPLDHLWVRGVLSEQDADKVMVGQTLKVVFPISRQTIDAKVEYVDRAIDPETRMAKFRTSIPNHQGRFKAGMFVRVLVELPQPPNQVAEPRTSANKTRGSSIQQRLEKLKPKLDLLLRVKSDQTATATFEAHLGAVEQELDLLIKEATEK
jgi:multidrug efflux pump subunit AcrA (membrane-fusion protein)